MPTINTTDYVSTAEAAVVLGLDVDSVRRYCANHSEGKSPAIEAMQVGRSWMISKKVLKQFAADRRSVGRPKAD